MKRAVSVLIALVVAASSVEGQGIPQRFQGPASQQAVDTTKKAAMQTDGVVCPDSTPIRMYEAMNTQSPVRCLARKTKAHLKIGKSDKWASIKLIAPLQGDGYIEQVNIPSIDQNLPHSTKKIPIHKEGEKLKMAKVDTVTMWRVDTLRLAGELRYIDRPYVVHDSIYVVDKGGACAYTSAKCLIPETIVGAALGYAAYALLGRPHEVTQDIIIDRRPVATNGLRRPSKGIGFRFAIH